MYYILGRIFLCLCHEAVLSKLQEEQRALKPTLAIKLYFQVVTFSPSQPSRLFFPYIKQLVITRSSFKHRFYVCLMWPVCFLLPCQWV